MWDSQSTGRKHCIKWLSIYFYKISIHEQINVDSIITVTSQELREVSTEMPFDCLFTSFFVGWHQRWLRESGFHRYTVDSPHKRPVLRKGFNVLWRAGGRRQNDENATTTTIMMVLLLLIVTMTSHEPRFISNHRQLEHLFNGLFMMAWQRNLPPLGYSKFKLHNAPFAKQ